MTLSSFIPRGKKFWLKKAKTSLNNTTDDDDDNDHDDDDNDVEDEDGDDNDNEPDGSSLELSH